jgi:enterochelin esterase-like enzyme
MKKMLSMAVLIYFCQAAAAQGGQVFETRTVKSEILQGERKYAIYLPPGYEETDRSYPVLYLLHGSGDDHTGWVQFGQVQHIADQAIGAGKAGPMIIVMPDANTGRRGYFNDVKGDFNYEDFFFQELIPHVEKEYRVRKERRYRAVSGLSMGGGGSLFYALHRPEVFAAAAPLSASTGGWELEAYRERLKEATANLPEETLEAHFRQHSVEGVLAAAPEEKLRLIKSVRWYISCGDDDFLYEGNARLHITFRKQGIGHEYRVKDGAHSWSYWRGELPLVLEFVSRAFMQD